MGIFRRMDEKGGDASRLTMVAVGLALGFAFGTIMWAVRGADGSWTVWLYIAVTTAMIGGGVAALFGAVGVKRKGERLSPRIVPRAAQEEKAEAKARKSAARAEAKAQADARKQSR
jgi:hypothetical protein